jgi:hypothetical protein
VRLILTLLLLTFHFVSPVEEKDVRTEAIEYRFVGSNPIYFEGGETARYFPKTGGYDNVIDGIENCNTVSTPDTAHGTIYDWTLSRVFDTVYQGNAAMRFEVRDSQPLVGGSARVRSEVRIIDGDIDSRFTPEMWYSEVLYFPASGMAQDSLSDETINQWFEDGGNDCLLRMRNKRMWLEVGSNKYDVFAPAIGSGSTASETTAANTFTKFTFDRWYQFVFHYIHSGDSGDGLVEVWRDGTLIHSIVAATLHTPSYPYWKIGIYKPDVTVHPETPKQSIRTFFVDNIMVGDENAVYSDMVSEEESGGEEESSGTFKIMKKYRFVNLPH